MLPRQLPRGSCAFVGCYIESMMMSEVASLVTVAASVGTCLALTSKSAKRGGAGGIGVKRGSCKTGCAEGWTCNQATGRCYKSGGPKRQPAKRPSQSTEPRSSDETGDETSDTASVVLRQVHQRRPIHFFPTLDEARAASAFDDYARRHGRAMRTTAEDRPGDLRGTLEEINTLGFVTTGFQIGCKHTFVRVDNGGSGVGWQRAYISGFLPKRRAEDLRAAMTLLDGIVCFAQNFYPDGHDDLDERTAPIPVEIATQQDEPGVFMPHSYFHMFAPDFESVVVDTLPEMSLERDPGLRKMIEPHVVHFGAVDTCWGRQTHLFKEVIAALKGESPVRLTASPSTHTECRVIGDAIKKPVTAKRRPQRRVR